MERILLLILSALWCLFSMCNFDVLIFFRVKRYAAKSRAEGDYYDAQFNNLDRLVTKLQNQILNKLD